MDLVIKWFSDNNLDKKPYQIDGIKWCLERETQGSIINEKCISGGLVADEMGLGKTITMLSMLVANPLQSTLIVLPKVLIPQWTVIIKKLFNIVPYIYHGQNITNITERKFNFIKSTNNIIITTYGMISLSNKENLLHNTSWNRIIYDEAHHLRNYKTKIFTGAHKLTFKSDIIWLVTGTPIQNKKSDFYSLCDIIGIPCEYYKKTENLPMLAKKFIIKRTKKDVGIAMPNLTTKVITVEWEYDDERQLAEEIHSKLGFSNVISKKTHFNVGTNSEFILPLLIKARQICISSNLIKDIRYIDDGECNITATSKIHSVVRAIISADKTNKKIVFCHYRGEIDELQKQLELHDLKVKIYDGRTKFKDRDSILTDSSDCDVLILQIQTGCEGLNLQDFNQVYFISPHWNPSIEKQAIARCHRIGQLKDVEVFRFIMASFDEEYETCNLEMHSKKIQEKKEEIASEICG